MLILRDLRKVLIGLLGFLIENPIIPFGIFIILVTRALIIQIKNSRKFSRLCKAIKNNPSNEYVKDLTALVKKMSVVNHPSSWNELRQAYYMVKELDCIDYDLKVELCKVLQKKGVSGVHPPRQSNPQQDEEKIRQAGQEGEKKVSYALKWLDKDRFKVFNNIKLSDGGEPQEFDSIVVGDKAVFNIETKNYIGNLTIDEEGNWYRTVNGHKSGMENPIFQIKRHNKVLYNILEAKMPIVDLIVWANIESVIEGAQFSLVKVIKVDQLTYFIENFNEGSNLSKEEIDFAINKIQSSIIN